MRKVLFALVLLAFTLTVQMPFFHVLDMEMGHVSAMEMHHGTASNIGLCESDTDQTGSQSCYTEISESKWMESVRKIGLAPFFTTALFTLFAIPLFFLWTHIFRVSLKRRTLYHSALYLGLYGIVRNVN